MINNNIMDENKNKTNTIISDIDSGIKNIENKFDNIEMEIIHKIAVKIVDNITILINDAFKKILNELCESLTTSNETVQNLSFENKLIFEIKNELRERIIEYK